MKAKIAAVVFLAAGLIAGCTTSPGVAATVNGHSVAIAEVDDGMALSPFYAQPPTPAQVAVSIVRARAVLEAAGSEGLGVSADQAAAFLDSIGAEAIKVDGEYTPTVLDLARMNLISQEVPAAGEAGQNVIDFVNDFMSTADIRLNPRYGEWDVAQGGLVTTLPEWIDPSP